jgi:hypothetical protein
MRIEVFAHTRREVVEGRRDFPTQFNDLRGLLGNGIVGKFGEFPDAVFRVDYARTGHARRPDQQRAEEEDE